MRSPHNTSFKARKMSKDISTWKNWEKREKAPFSRELSDFRYCSKQKSYCAFGKACGGVATPTLGISIIGAFTPTIKSLGLTISTTGSFKATIKPSDSAGTGD